MNVEQEIKDALGLSHPEIVLELLPKIEPEPQPTVTIYDFANLLTKYELPKKRREITSGDLLLMRSPLADILPSPIAGAYATTSHLHSKPRNLFMKRPHLDYAFRLRSRQARRPQIIAICITGAAATIAVGYFGVKFLGRNTMYAISGGTIGLGVGTYAIQALEKKRTRQVKIEQLIKGKV
ncbi:hypothetical protein WKK05_04025 [Nostoc sp. UHCC 0302]|uniref:hypothetical protein n=1 Tax=Nostoc sp. UHCC 0302 TaxID=3134896 RepID=UPI00311CD0A9